MANFQLSSLFTINGVGAASGLVYTNNQLYIVSDNSTFLYQYDTIKQELIKIKLDKYSQDNIAKKDKPDFESITLYNNKLYLYGSGSTENRYQRVTYNLENSEIEEKDLSKVYKQLKKQTSISDKDLNIEGVIITELKNYFFQRGNKGNDANGVLIYDKETKEVRFQVIKLPMVDGIPADFSDAVLVNDKVYFLAAIENTNSTYEDGKVLGSFIGCFTLANFELHFIEKISDNQKFEGLTLYQQNDEEISFLLCEDNDTEALVSIIYKLVI